MLHLYSCEYAPDQPRLLGRPVKYPWDLVSVGERFTVTDATLAAVIAAARRRCANVRGEKYKCSVFGERILVERTA